MPTTEILLAFIISTSIFAFMPGPALLYTAAQTIARGKRAGLMTCLGIHLGGYFHVLTAVLGLSLVFHAVPVLYTVLKICGAAYLIWIGIQMFRQPDDLSASPIVRTEKSARRAFFQSVTVEVLNPKAALFFLAFLPQFTDASAAFPIWLQFLILGTIVNLVFSSADLICVGMATMIVDRLKKSSRAQHITRRLGGGILIGLGAHLALNKS